VGVRAWRRAVKQGDRVAQLILERILTPEVEEVEDLDATDRGAGGFGSTGVSKAV
jgi:dUTP pyrophosphatase